MADLGSVSKQNHVKSSYLIFPNSRLKAFLVLEYMMHKGRKWLSLKPVGVFSKAREEFPDTASITGHMIIKHGALSAGHHFSMTSRFEFRLFGNQELSGIPLCLVGTWMFPPS